MIEQEAAPESNTRRSVNHEASVVDLPDVGEPRLL